jgi:hypothetical protein
MATVPFIVEEFGGVARTNAPMRFPIVIPLAVSDNVLTVNTSRVLDGATPVEAQFEIIARYGGGNSQIGGVNDDATRPARFIHCWLAPTLTAGGVKNYTYQSTGGSGNSVAGITVQAVSTHYVVNTGTGGIIAHIPRTGAQSILRFLQLVGGATILNGDGGGLWIQGIATDSQAGDYFSRFDTAADGVTNNWAPTELAAPVKYFTEHTKPGPLRTTFTVRRVRLRATSGGLQFEGKRRIPPGNSGAQARPVIADVQLTFFKGRPEILLQVTNLSTQGGHYILGTDLAADCAIKGFGIDFATVFGGTNAALATRDEGAAEKWSTATATADVAIRQRTGNYTNQNGTRPASTYISSGSYGWTLDESGPFTLASATTQLEAGFDVSTAGGGAGLLVAPWNWKNRFPMGWSYNRTTGVLRWEILNPAEADTTRTAAEHILLGFQWCYAEAWLIPHAAALTNAQRVAAVRATAGHHVYRHNNATVVTDLTHPIRGRQQATLLGRCAHAVWNASGAWRLIPPPLSGRTVATGMLANVGGSSTLAPRIAGSASRYEDACRRYDQWFEAEFDDTARTGQAFSDIPASMEATHAVPNPGNSAAGYTIGGIVGPLGWREDGCYPCSGGAVGPNDYEKNSYPGLFWLSAGQPHHFALGWERTLHQATSDVMKMYWSTARHGLQGRNISPFGGRRFHSDGSSGGDQTGSVLEFQQLHEALVWWYVLTGSDQIRQVLDYVLNFIRIYFFAAQDVATHDVRNRWTKTGTVVNGSNVVTVASTADVFAGPNGVWATYRPFAAANLGTATSSGNTITFAAPIQPSPTGRHFWNHAVWTPDRNRAHAPGVQLTFGGAPYQVLSAILPDGVLGQCTGFTVTPTPPPQTSTLVATNWYGNSGQRFVHVASPTTLTMGSGNTPNTHDTGTVTISAGSTGLLRRTAWPMHTLIAMCRVFGRHYKTAQEPDGMDIFQGMWEMAQHIVFCEQQDSSDGAKAQMGGLGTALNSGQQFNMVEEHGLLNAVNATSTDYAMPPTLAAHEFATAAAGWGYGSIFTSATRTVVLNFMDRYCRFMWMGVDGLSPIESGGDMVRMGAPQRIPMARGGDLQSPTSYHMVGHCQGFVVVELWSAPGRTGVDGIHKCGVDLTRLTTSVAQGMRMQGGKGDTSATTYCGDVLVYVAEQKWNAPGAVDLPRRTAYTRKAIQGWIDGACFMADATGGSIGTYHNPNTYGNIFGGRQSNGNAVNVVRHRDWLCNAGARLMLKVANGWSGGVVDTTPPTETALLALVNKTETQITVDGPGATDNVAVVDYLFFKGGVQDGPAQTGTAHTYQNLEPSTTYSLTRRARDGAGLVSNDSNTLSIQTNGAVDTTPPTVPTGLEGETTTTTATVRWLPSTDEESSVGRYVIERNGVVIGEVIP